MHNLEHKAFHCSPSFRGTGCLRLGSQLKINNIKSRVIQAEDFGCKFYSVLFSNRSLCVCACVHNNVYCMVVYKILRPNLLPVVDNCTSAE